MLNQCQFIGNLGRDPEVRTFANGDKVVNLRLAVTEKWRDKASGERKEKTEWVSVAIFNQGIGKIAEQYLQKGSQVFISGQLETRKWQDQAGADRYTTEIVLRPFRGEMTLLGGKGDGGQRNDDAGGQSSGQVGGYGRAGDPDDGSDIPF